MRHMFGLAPPLWGFGVRAGGREGHVGYGENRRPDPANQAVRRMVDFRRRPKLGGEA
jgi:hypothetical protein